MWRMVLDMQARTCAWHVQGICPGNGSDVRAWQKCGYAEAATLVVQNIQ